MIVQAGIYDNFHQRFRILEKAVTEYPYIKRARNKIQEPALKCFPKTKKEGQALRSKRSSCGNASFWNEDNKRNTRLKEGKTN